MDQTAAPQSQELTDEQIRRLFGVVLAELRSLSLTNARAAVASAGIVGVNSPQQYWDPFLAGVETAFNRLEPEAQFAALRILAARFSDSENVKKLFAQHGYQYIDGVFVPAALLDEREARYLPRSSAFELSKAMKRLVEGDESGAITAACGAVDTLMQHLYVTHNLGDPGKVAFAAKVGTATARLNIFEDMMDQLTALGIKNDLASEIITDMRKSTNYAARMLQGLRKAMGDVHGSKPALRRSAYDTIKWASAICALFEGR